MKCKPWVNPHSTEDGSRHFPAGFAKCVLPSSVSKKSPSFHVVGNDVAPTMKLERLESDVVEVLQIVRGWGGSIVALYETRW